MSTADESLAAAYGQLVQEGQRPTVRALRDRAAVSTETARAWLAERRSSPDLPQVPDAWASVWPVVYAAARDLALADVAEELAAARDAEAEALAAADEARRAQQRAEAATKQLAAQHEIVSSREADAQLYIESVDHDLKCARSEVARLTAAVAAAEERAVRAEAQTDMMRGLVDDLRADLRTVATTGRMKEN